MDVLRLAALLELPAINLNNELIVCRRKNKNKRKSARRNHTERINNITSFKRNQMNELLTPMSESKSVELKRWFDPTSIEGICKILKSIVALKNINGGRLIIGINDNGEFDYECIDLFNKYKSDDIQKMISDYVYETFEIVLFKYMKNDLKAVIITIPPGFETPVLFKKDLEIEGKLKIKKDVLYIRTLRSNGTYSSSEAKHEDWKTVLDLCFSNREANIAEFIRKNFSIDKLISSIKTLKSETDESFKTDNDKILELLAYANEEWQYHRTIIASKYSEATNNDTKFGTYFNISYPVDGYRRNENNRELLHKILSLNPRLTGWPFWSNISTIKNFIPEIHKSRWEKFIYAEPHVDYWTINFNNGVFSQIRILEDDFAHSYFKDISPRSFFNPIIAVYRILEAIITSREFYIGLGFNNLKVLYIFGWEDLLSRKLSNYSDYPQFPSFFGKATDTPGLIYEVIALDSNEGRIISSAKEIINKVTNCFSGESVSEQIVQDIFNALKRRNDSFKLI
jgi:hypothetical protein